MVTPDLHVSEILKSVLPKLDDDQLEQLERNIMRDGRAIKPILYWHFEDKNWVVDGMHRLPISQRLGLPYKTEPVEIQGGWLEAANWIVDHQRGQRNWTRAQIGEWYNNLKAWRAKHLDNKVSNDTSSSEGAPPEGDSAARIAGVTGTSIRTVKRAGKRMDLLSSCTPSVQKGIDSDAFKISDADLETMAKLTPDDQNAVARQMRFGKTFKQATSEQGIKPPAKPKASGGGAPKKKATKKKTGKQLTEKEQEVLFAKEQICIWYKTVGRWLGEHPSIDKYRAKWPGPLGDEVLEHAKSLYKSLRVWKNKGIK